MPNDVFIAILAAALMNAIWNTAVKVAGDKLSAMALTTLFGSAISIPVLAWVDMPRPESWALLALSIGIHTLYHLVLSSAYRHGELGKAYPVARGVAPLLVTLAALALTGELPPSLALIGISCISLGVLALVMHRGGFPDASNGMGFALFTGMLIALYTVVDSHGVRLAGSALGFAAVLTLGDGIATGLAVLAWKGGALVRLDRQTVRLCAFAGAMQAGAYWIAVWALSVAPMSSVSALRESSVLFVAAISTLFLKEKFTRLRLISSLLIFVGIVAVRIGTP